MPRIDKPSLEVISRTPATGTGEGRPPLLFVHGLGHAAWSWENWLDAAADAGYRAYAVSLRGHGGSGGRLGSSVLGDYVDDVVQTALGLDEEPVLVGHSLGGLVVQKALAQVRARAGVLIAPVPAHPAVGALLSVARQHPTDALRMAGLRSLPLRPSYLFGRLDPAEARRLSDRMGRESGLAQYQLLFHLPAPAPLGGAPVLVLAAPDDRLVPIRDVRRTARRYSAEIQEFPGMGHDLVLDAGWEEPFAAMTAWLEGLERLPG